MKLIRRCAALALTVLLALSLSVPALAAGNTLYQDTPDTAALDLLKLVNVFDGYTDGNFHGEKVLTRAQLTKVACQLLGVTVDENAVPTFTDAKDNWAAAYIAAAAKAGIVQGKTAEVFAPDAPVTRYQAAMMFARMVGYDDSSIASLPWGERVETAVNAAGLTGFLTLDGGALTRAEAANAAYTTLLAKQLSPSEPSAALTANTLAGKLGITAERGKAADGTATVQFIIYKGGTRKTAAYPVAAGSSFPAATAAPVSAKVQAEEPGKFYGYVVGEPGEALWGDGETYNVVSFWNGAKTGELHTTRSIPSQRPLVLSYERNPDGSISGLRFNYPGDGTLLVGAVTDMEEDTYLRMSDGTAYLFTEDTVVLYINSDLEEPEKIGCADGIISEADKDGDGNYINNVFFMLDEKGKLACVVYDVDNAVPSLVP